MDEDIMQYLKTSLDNENNESIFDLTNSIIKERKEEIINELPITKKMKNEFIKKLKEYRYIDELQEFHIGCYIRWIKLDDSEPEIKLNNGAILISIKIDDNVSLICRNFMNRFFTINANDTLIFQKLSYQEQIILYSIDNIDKIKS